MTAASDWLWNTFAHPVGQVSGVDDGQPVLHKQRYVVIQCQPWFQVGHSVVAVGAAHGADLRHR